MIYDVKPWNSRIGELGSLARPLQHEGAGGGGTRFTERMKQATAAVRPKVPLHILSARPAYIPEPVSEPTGDNRRYYIQWGVLNDKLATNWDAHYDLAVTTYFFAKASLRVNDTLLVTSWEVVTGPAIDTHETEDWLVGEARPSEAIYLLGSVIVTDGEHAVTHTGGGSLVLTEHITNFWPDGAATEFGKNLVFLRQNY